MTRTVFSISMSLDGCIAGPGDDPDLPMGRSGDILHRWLTEAATDADRSILDDALAGLGAQVVGRRMFDNSHAWGGNPPGGVPCFVVTHQPPLEWQGPESLFTFVTDGVDSAVKQASVAAGDKAVAIGGGAQIIRQALRAELVEEAHIQLVPVVLGAGIRLFESAPDAVPAEFELIQAIPTPNAVHLSYRINGASATGTAR